MTNKSLLINDRFSLMYKLLSLLILNIISINIAAQNTDYQQLNANKFSHLINSNTGIILDVRTMNEFKNGHLKDAIAIPTT